MVQTMSGVVEARRMVTVVGPFCAACKNSLLCA